MIACTNKQSPKFIHFAMLGVLHFDLIALLLQDHASRRKTPYFLFPASDIFRIVYYLLLLSSERNALFCTSLLAN